MFLKFNFFSLSILIFKNHRCRHLLHKTFFILPRTPLLPYNHGNLKNDNQRKENRKQTHAIMNTGSLAWLVSVPHLNYDSPTTVSFDSISDFSVISDINNTLKLNISNHVS